MLIGAITKIRVFSFPQEVNIVAKLDFFLIISQVHLKHIPHNFRFTHKLFPPKFLLLSILFERERKKRGKNRGVGFTP